MIATMPQRFSGPTIPSPSPVVARLAGTGKTYGRIRALHNVSLDVHAGELVAVLGPNGAGKTTAVKLRLGLAHADAVTVTVFGDDPRQPENRMRNRAHRIPARRTSLGIMASFANRRKHTTRTRFPGLGGGSTCGKIVQARTADSMIYGAHVVIYSKDAKADRAFFRDTLGFAHVDGGGEWLIFALPPAEVAVHPADENDTHELFLMCKDLKAQIATLAKKGIQCSDVQEAGWGAITRIHLPGGGKVGLYQPKHPTALTKATLTP